MSEPRCRNLIVSFWKLASSQRREIAKHFKLLSDSEWKLPEPERYGRALIHASEQGLLDAVEERIQQMERGK